MVKDAWKKPCLPLSCYFPGCGPNLPHITYQLIAVHNRKLQVFSGRMTRKAFFFSRKTACDNHISFKPAVPLVKSSQKMLYIGFSSPKYRHAQPVTVGSCNYWSHTVIIVFWRSCLGKWPYLLGSSKLMGISYSERKTFPVTFLSGNYDLYLRFQKIICLK